MKHIIYIILFLISFQGIAQKSVDSKYGESTFYLLDSLILSELQPDEKELLDSILTVYHQNIDDTTQVEMLSYLTENLYHSAWIKYNDLLATRTKQYQSYKNKDKQKFYGTYHSMALGNKGFLLKKSGNPTEALKLYKAALEVSKKVGHERGSANTMNNIAAVYVNQGLIEKALEMYMNCAKINERIGNKKSAGYNYMWISYIYKGQEDSTLTIEYLQRAISTFEEINNSLGIAKSTGNLGVLYKQYGQLDKALEFYQKSIEMNKLLGNESGIASGHNNIGNIYRLQKKYESAEYHLLKGIELRRALNEKRGLTTTLSELGLLYLDNNKTKQALTLGHEALILAKELGYPLSLSDASSLLTQVYKKLGDYRKALEMNELYMSSNDSIRNNKTQKSTIQLQAKYEYEKQKVLDDAEHDKLLALEQEAKAKQKVITYATAGGLGLVAIFLIFVFNRLQVTKKQKIVIEEQRDIVEEAHKEIRDSINYAERIQRSFLATDELLDNNLKDYFVFFQPKDVVSGDFYWAGKLANNNFAVVNADSTGHGVPGAIMSILNISSIEKAVENGHLKPSEIFNHTRDTIIERLSKDGSESGGKDGMDASIISFDFDNNTFSYTAAQNPIWIVRDGELIEIKAEKMPIGKHDNDVNPFVGGEFETIKGDVVYTLTDGFQDQFGGEKGKKFKVRPFKNLLISIAQLPMQEQKEILNSKFITWKGEEEQVDDVCVIGVRV
jgi:serine phosphatase RsbU (regulator of sigma subunit)